MENPGHIANLPGTVREAEPDLRHFRDVLEADFARLGHQLRRDVSRELRQALREALAGSPPTAAPAVNLAATHGGGTSLSARAQLQRGAHSQTEAWVPEAPGAPGHHEWTRRHVRGFLAAEFIQSLPETAPEAVAARSPAPQSPVAVAVAQQVLPEASESLDTTLKSTALPELLRQAAEDLPPEEDHAQPQEEVPRPPTGETGSTETEKKSPPRLTIGGHTPKTMSNLTPQRALGLVPSNTRFIKVHTGEDPTTCRHRLAVIVCGPWFERLALFMNIASAAMVGYQTDHMARNIDDHYSLLFQVTDRLFLAFFTIEAALRLAVHRCRFFRMTGWGWNVFDLLLVVFQFSEEVVAVVVSVRGNDLWSSFLLRVVRVLRTIKLFRVMGSFDEFRLLVACILHSCKSFFWAVALLLLMNYVMATYLVQIISSSRLSGDLSKINWEQDLREWYGSLAPAVYSIFLGLTGGVDWNDIVDPIKVHISPAAASLFVAFMLFAILALMNVVTGTFVQTAIDRADEVKQINKVQQARRLFKSLDVDSSGFVGFNELRSHLDSPEVQGYFRAVDVDLSEAKCLFDMLDMNDSGTIDFQEFLSGCVRLQGHARSLDLLMIARDMRCSFDEIAKRFEGLAENQRAMRSALATLAREDVDDASSDASA